MNMEVAARGLADLREENPQEKSQHISGADAGFPTRYVRFGDFVLDAQRQDLIKSGERARIPGKVFQVLIALLQRPGEIVTREDLRARLWASDTHVNFDANVNTTVNKLRLALGDSPDQPVYVETIPRQGYSFVGKVAVGSQTGTPRREGNGPAVMESAEIGSEAGREASLNRSFTSKWFVAGVIALVLSGMFFGAAAVLYLHHVS